jgi:hypothetical protein
MKQSAGIGNLGGEIGGGIMQNSEMPPAGDQRAKTQRNIG